MKTLRIKSPILSAIAFFSTLCVLSVGYATYSALTNVSSGGQLKSSDWNAMVADLTDHESRLANFAFSSGNVGVGTASPISPLHIYSALNGMTAGYSRVLTLNANHPVLQFKGISDTNHSGYIGYDAQSTSEWMRFWVGQNGDDNGGTAAAAMNIKPSGNVGINTTNPQSKLDVNGTIRSLWDGSQWTSDNHAFCISGGAYVLTRHQAALACKATGMRLCTLAELSAYAEADQSSCCWGWVSDPASNNSPTNGKVAYFMYSSATALPITAGCGGSPGWMRIMDNSSDTATFSAHCCR